MHMYTSTIIANMHHWTAGNGFENQRSRVQTPVLLSNSVVICMVLCTVRNQKWFGKRMGVTSVIAASNEYVEKYQIDYVEKPETSLV